MFTLGKYTFPETLEGLECLRGDARVGSADFLRLAYQMAEVASDDPKTKNGAVLVTASGALFYGANHLPVPVRPELLLPENKDPLIVHAERACLNAAARAGVSTFRSVMYCCWAPCIGCAATIIDTGVSMLIVHKEMHDRTYEKYKKSIEIAGSYLAERDVGYAMHSGPIGGVTGRMNNEDWLP